MKNVSSCYAAVRKTHNTEITTTFSDLEKHKMAVKKIIKAPLYIVADQITSKII